MKSIYYNKQSINNQDVKSIISVLHHDKITTGKAVDKFEKNISNFTSAKYVVTSTNATSSIHLSLISINLKKNDIVIMPSVNFISAFNMCKFMQAKVYLADVDPITGQMTHENLFECIKKNKLSKIKAVITMYLGGSPENVIELYKLKRKHKFILIEDACHAFGASYKHKNKLYKVGSCRHSDICTFSFHPVKPITTGEGGALTTNNPIFAKKAKLYRSHNIIRHKNRHWIYDIQSVGMNYRLSDINCALGNSQLKRINSFLEIRKKISKMYDKNLSKFKNFIKTANYNKNSSYHLKILIFNFSKLKCNKNEVFAYFKKKRIFLQYHYIPIYLFKIGRKYSNSNNFHGANKYYRSAISFPIHCNLTKKQFEKIIQTLTLFIKKYSKRNA